MGNTERQSPSNLPVESSSTVTYNKTTKNHQPKQSYATITTQHNQLTERAQQILNDPAYYKDMPEVSEEPIYLILERKSTYQGSFSRGIPNGKGIVHFSNGGLYAGQFQNGDAEGKGVYVFPDGKVYSGSFKNSKFNGKGALSLNNKAFHFEGDFVDGIPNGQGKQISINLKTGEKTAYEGEFRNGKKEGYGKYTWDTGKQYKGYFMNGTMHGKGTIYSPEGYILYDGNFRFGKKAGYGIMSTKQGSYEGTFENDRLNGTGTYLWKDGKAFEGEFKDTQMHGQGVIYYPSNQYAKGEWEQNHNIHLNSLKYDQSVETKLAEIKERHLKNIRQETQKFNEPFYENQQDERYSSYSSERNRVDRTQT